MMFDGPVLVVAAHPDDEVLGCGGTIARLVDEGVHVETFILGRNLRCEPVTVRDANTVLGANVEWDGFPDNEFDDVPLLEIVQAVERIVAFTQPRTVLTHHPGDVNIDHQITHRAVLAATRPVNGCSVKTVACFEVPSSSEWAYGSLAPFRSQLFVDIGATLERKVAAMEAYESERRPAPHPRAPESLRALARMRGYQTGVEYAEAFELVRMVAAEPPVCEGTIPSRERAVGREAE